MLRSLSQCNETRPHCANCIKANLPCVFLPNQRAKWIHTTSGDQQSHPANTPATLPPGSGQCTESRKINLPTTLLRKSDNPGFDQREFLHRFCSHISNLDTGVCTATDVAIHG